MKKFNFEKTKVYNNIPKGWRITEGTTTEPHGYKWISNNKSRFSGERESGLLRLKK